MYITGIRKNITQRTAVTFLAVILIMSLIFGQNLTPTLAYFTDVETAASNTLQAWSASLWTQTSEVDFNNGILNDVNTALNPGDVKLRKVLMEPTTSTGAEQTWYYAAWSRRAPITITNTGSAQTDYLVRVDVAYDGDMQADFDDIRFVDSDDATPLNFWRETYTASTSAVFWVKIPSIPAGSKTIYMYYGNGTVGNASDGDNTFIFYDTFPGSSLNGSKWNIWSATATVAGSVVAMKRTSSAAFSWNVPNQSSFFSISRYSSSGNSLTL